MTPLKVLRRLQRSLALLFVAASGTLGSALAQEDQRPSDPRRPGTIAMASQLKDLVKSGTPITNPFLNRKALEVFENAYQTAVQAPENSRKPYGVMSAHYRHANELLNSGKGEMAATSFNQLLDSIEEHQLNVSEVQERILRLNQGLGYLRQGEHQNCLLSHNSDSCLAPLKNGGIRTQPSGSQLAIESFQKILTKNPRDLSAAWLLNLAYRTLGKYPDDVPQPWVIPPQRFESEEKLQAGLAVDGLAEGSIMEDFDNDGDQDLYLSRRGQPNYLLKNQGTNQAPHFVNVAKEAGVQDPIRSFPTWFWSFDHDGEQDIYTVMGGGSFGCSPLRQEIGLGKTSTIQSIDISWPTSRKRQIFKDVSLKKFYMINEDPGIVSEVTHNPSILNSRDRIPTIIIT